MNKPWRRVVVHGDSMRPTLHPGDCLLVLRLRIKPGDLVAIETPDRTVVKRVAAVNPISVDAVGDNPAASTDYLSAPRRDVVGRVVYRYAPSDRVGRLH
jgi:phage repressor protein C with HTH and peptisase S24 domain